MLWLAPAQKGLLNRAHVITAAEVPEGRTGTGGAAVTMWTLAGCSAASSWTPAKRAEICVTSRTCTTTRPAEW